MYCGRLVLYIPAALLVTTALAAQQTSAEVAARAFEPYEAVRTALAADTIDGIPDHAAQLAPLAGELAGPDAATAAERLRQSTDLKSAREAFGVLSTALVPKFLEANLADVVGFRCSMVRLPWVQRGARVQNPYMGKAMSTCGERIRKISTSRAPAESVAPTAALARSPDAFFSGLM